MPQGNPHRLSTTPRASWRLRLARHLVDHEIGVAEKRRGVTETILAALTDKPETIDAIFERYTAGQARGKEEIDRILFAMARNGVVVCSTPPPDGIRFYRLRRPGELMAR